MLIPKSTFSMFCDARRLAYVGRIYLQILLSKTLNFEKAFAWEICFPFTNLKEKMRERERERARERERSAFQWGRIRGIKTARERNVFFKWARPGLFLYTFHFLNYKFYRKNCMFQRDSNSNRQSRRQAWPPPPRPKAKEKRYIGSCRMITKTG